jgi:IPT/TIG domain-containing protein/Kelch motif protein
MFYRFTVFILLLLVTLTLLTCNRDNVTPREYPRVKTMEVSSISTEGAIFKAEIVFPGSGEIIEYGFVWGENDKPTIDSSEKKIIASTITTGSFEANISTTLKEGVSYYVRAYAKNDEYLVYGKVVSFLSLGSGAPIMVTYLPQSGTIGDTIIIYGQNFSYLENNNILFFGNNKSLTLSASDSTVTTIVPDSLKESSSIIKIEIAGNISSLNEPFKLLAPDIDSLSKNTGIYGDTVQIYGKYFGNNTGQVKVYFEGRLAKIIGYSKNKLDVIVPNGIEGTGEIKVVVAHQNDKIDFLFLKPELIDFSPELATWGDTITIYGKYFNKNIEGQKISLEGKEYNIIDINNDSLRFVVPEDIIRKKSIDLSLPIAGLVLSFNKKIMLKEPVVITVVPDTVNLGDEVTVEIINLHPSWNNFRLKYRGTSREEFIKLDPIQTSPNVFEFYVPSNISDLRNSEPADNILVFWIEVGSGTFYLTQDIIVRAPIINSVNPLLINSLQDAITINGKNFGDNPIITFGSNNIAYPDDIQIQPISSSETEIVLRIPPSVLNNELVSEEVTGLIKVTKSNRTAWSDPVLLNHQTPWSKINESGLFNFNDGSFRSGYKKWSDGQFGYLLGGQKWYQFSANVRLNDFWRYDPTTDSWSQLANVPFITNTSRYVFNDDNYTYVIYTGIGNYLKRYDHNTNTWSNLNNPPEAINGVLNTFMVGEKQFIIDANDEKLYEYSISSDTWSEINIPDLPFRKESYTFNGKQRFILSGSEYEFDPNTYSGTTTAKNHTSGARIFENNGKYYKHGEDLNLYLYDPVTDTQTLETAMPYEIIPYTSNYFFSIYGKLYFMAFGVSAFDTNF